MSVNMIETKHALVDRNLFKVNKITSEQWSGEHYFDDFEQGFFVHKINKYIHMNFYIWQQH